MGILCFTFTSSFSLLNSHLLKQTGITQYIHSIHDTDGYTIQRNLLVQLAAKEIGVREKTGNNDGIRVEEYLASVNLKKGQPWCAAFICYIYHQAGLAKPSTGWTPDMFPSSRLSKSALPGNIAGIYFPALKRIAHVGLITKTEGDWIITTEGNTNITGSREGDGVYLKWRHRRTVYQISDWLSAKKSKS